MTETPRLQGGEGYGTCEDEGRGGANLYRYGSQGTARGSRVQNREMEDGGYGPDTLKIKNEKSVDNFRIQWYTNRRKDLITRNPFLIWGGCLV